MEGYESVLLVKPEVFVFNIPPRSSNRGYRAADWKLNEPSWTGRMRLVSKGNECAIKLEDKNTGELFAKCPIETYPGIAVESVLDSSRYFVLRIQDDSGGRSAFIGMGFGDRSDSFDLNVALQDHFKWVKKEKQISEEPTSGPSLDLGFKEGETIKINMKITKKDGSDGSKVKAQSTGGGLGLLPPPPSSGKLPAPPGSSPAGSPAHQPKSPNSENWGEFTSAQANSQSEKASPSSTNSNWVQF